MDHAELKRIANSMIATLETTFTEYLETENLPDNNMTRAAFYEAGVREMTLHPDEDLEFQNFMMTLVTDMRNRYVAAASEELLNLYFKK